MRKLPDDLSARMDDAARVIAELGYDNAKMEDIARATGISKTQLYYWFEGKQAILAQIVKSLVDEMGRRVAHTIEAEEAKGSPAVDRVEAVIRSHVSVMRDRPWAALVALTEFVRAMGIHNIAEMTNDYYHNPMAKLFALGVEDGSLRPVADPQAVSGAMYGGTVTSSIGLIIVNPRDHRTIGDHADQLVDFYLGGLRASAERRSLQ